jgi:hypothetical protein
LLRDPLLEGAHQGAADAAAAMLAADQDLLDPGHWPAGVEGEVPEAQQVAKALTALGGQEQARVGGGEELRVGEVELLPREGERLRQLAGEQGDGPGVGRAGMPDLDL